VTKLYYPAVLEQGEDGGFGVFFPDLDGCVSAGDTIDEAARNAEEVLALHLEGMAEEGEPIPLARSLGAIERDPEVNEVARLLVGAEEPKAGERVNVWLPKSLLAQLDAAAALAGRSRSAFLREAARMVLEPSDTSLQHDSDLTIAEKIELVVKKRPGLSKTEIARAVVGVPIQQRVNADVNRLVNQGRIVSDNGWPARFTTPGVSFNRATGRPINTKSGEPPVAKGF